MDFPSIRWGLCCQFIDAPIKFRTATHRYVSSLKKRDGRAYLTQIARDNAAALGLAVEECSRLGIGAFRVNSAILPLSTHPVSGYRLEEIDPQGIARDGFLRAGRRARELDIRLSFHPDQFVVLSSERADVVAFGQREIEYQNGVAELIGADTIVVHGGSGAGGPAAALERLARGIDGLSDSARSRLALENDDSRFSPELLLPVCRKLGLPLVYDVHHHRCLPDGLSISEATQRMRESWGNREPFAHLSSPRDGWQARDRKPHADFIDPADVPVEWTGRMTVDVEAKQKDRAIGALMAGLAVNAPESSGLTRSHRAPQAAARSSAPRRSRTTR